MDPVTAWLLGSVVVPDAYQRLVNIVAHRPDRKRLEAQVRDISGMRPSRAYRQWLKSETTWQDLVAGQPEALELLISSLHERERQRKFRRRPPDRAESVPLVEATIASFVQTLDPSMAVAVAEWRTQGRHQELLNRLDAARSLEQLLSAVPPGARELLEAEAKRHGAAEQVVAALATPEAHQTITSWAQQPPDWLMSASGAIHCALAIAANSHGLREAAASFFESAADLGHHPVRSLARAAFERTACGQSDRASVLIERALEIDGESSYARVIAAALDEDPSGVLEAVDETAARTDALIGQMYALALDHGGRGDEAISILSDLVSQYPDYAGTALALVRLLMKRSRRSGTTSRTRDLERARSLAEDARDARRVWHGNSAEAVELTCTVALLRRDFDDVLRLGTAGSTGDALPAEAAAPEVQFCVAQAALARGDLDAVRQVAEAADGFRRALILADLLVASDAPQDKINQQYARVWHLAASEDDKVSFWLSASSAGVDPLPGEVELRQREDELPVLIDASRLIAAERPSEAVSLLRPIHDSESARQLLVNAYLRAGDVDAAVVELTDAAQRFDHSDHLIRAVEVLTGPGRLADAAPIADRCLSLTSPRQPGRDLLHEVGVAQANNIGNWQDMEARLRAWMEDSGVTQRRVWMLINALMNQAELDAAWTVHQENPELSPQNPLEAQLWIALHVSRDADPDATLSGALELCNEFEDDPDVRGSAVNAFFARGDKELTDTERDRWHELIRLRTEKPAEDDSFQSISLPENPDDLAETFRPLLEPQAQRVEQAVERVRTEGWPYGILALAASRTYASALAQRAAGYLPIAVAADELLQPELVDAEAALNRQVTADVSVLTTSWFINQTWPLFVACFSRISLTGEARRDVATAAESLHPEATGTLGWDLRTGRPFFEEADLEDMARLSKHLSWANARAAELPTHEDSTSDDGTSVGPWMSSFRAARDLGQPLWADDVGLRALARNEGVPTFGSVALLTLLLRSGKIEPDTHAATLRTLRDEYCVDLPLDADWLLEAARRNDFRVGPASFAFTRRGTWVDDLPAALDLWRTVVRECGHHYPEHLASWVYAGAVGLMASVVPPVVVDLSAGLLVAVTAEATRDSGSFARCADALAQAAAEANLHDPVETAIRTLYDLLTQHMGMEDGARALAQLGSQLAEHHRESLRRVLFNVRAPTMEAHPRVDLR